ncbi:MAG: type II toxin-antitoxin system HipA family toxin [Verrucomicrobiota bacterium]
MRLNVHYEGRRVGQLLERTGRHYFEYDREFIADSLPLSPQYLPVRRGVFENTDGHFLGLPGLFYDSLPDHFGMEVVRRHFRAKSNHSPSPLQILSYLGNRTMGALTYSPPEGDREQEHAVNLVNAARSARQLIEKEHGPKLDPALVASGATAGGAMPKILIAMSASGDRILTGATETPADMEPWLLKLDTIGDESTSKCRLEYAYSKMAADCGIRIPNTRLIKDSNQVDHFAIRRFDRALTKPNQKIHTHSYAGLFHLNFRDSSFDYDDLLRRTRGLTRSENEVREQFKRIVFNILGHNRDDHAKNFSFQMDASGAWNLTPAYDLIFSENNLGGNWMLLNGKRGQIVKQDLLDLARQHSIPEKLTETIIDETQDTLADWARYASEAGLGEGYTKAIEKALSDNVV